MSLDTLVLRDNRPFGDTGSINDYDVVTSDCGNDPTLALFGITGYAPVEYQMFVQATPAAQPRLTWNLPDVNHGYIRVYKLGARDTNRRIWWSDFDDPGTAVSWQDGASVYIPAIDETPLFIPKKKFFWVTDGSYEPSDYANGGQAGAEGGGENSQHAPLNFLGTIIVADSFSDTAQNDNIPDENFVPYTTNMITGLNIYRKTSAFPDNPLDTTGGSLIAGPSVLGKTTVAVANFVPAAGNDIVGGLRVNDHSWLNLTYVDRVFLPGIGVFQVTGKSNTGPATLFLRYLPTDTGPLDPNTGKGACENNRHSGESIPVNTPVIAASLIETTAVPPGGEFDYRMIINTDDFDAPINDVKIAAGSGGGANSGQSVWAQRFGLDQYYDTASITAVTGHPSGDLIVAGGFANTISISPITNATISGNGFSLFACRYNTAHIPVWTYIPVILGTANNFINAIACDTAGDIYVCGSFSGRITFPGQPQDSSAGLDDAFVAKFSGVDGHFIWRKIFGGAGADKAFGITIDQDGNVIVTGQFAGTVDFGAGTNLTSNGSWDGFMLKLNPTTGATIWQLQIGGNSDDKAYGVAAVPSGGVVVAGYMWSSSINFGGTTKNLIGGGDLWVAKYLTTGSAASLQWVNNYGGTGAYFNSPVGVAVGASGEVAITTAVKGTVDLGGGNLSAPDATGIIVAKYTSSGTHSWSRVDGGVGSINNDLGVKVAIDSSGNVYVVGRLRSGWDFGCGFLTFNPLTSDPLTLKLKSSDGSCMWSNRYSSGQSGAGSDSDFGYGIVLIGNYIYACGLYSGAMSFGSSVQITAVPGATEGYVVQVNK